MMCCLVSLVGHNATEEIKCHGLQKFEYDVWYVDNLSFITDVKVIFTTIYKVIKREGVDSEAGTIVEDFNGSNWQKMKHLNFTETQIEKLEYFSKKFNTNLLVKRDDLGFQEIGGGSKARMLMYILSDYADGNYDTIVTAGGRIQISIVLVHFCALVLELKCT